MKTTFSPLEKLHFGSQNRSKIEGDVGFHSWMLFFIAWGGLLASFEPLGIDLGRILNFEWKSGGPKEAHKRPKMDSKNQSKKA